MIYYLSRPSVKHVASMENAEKVKCDICGEECWKRPELEKQVRLRHGKDHVIPCCTECAIRGMLSGVGRKAEL